MRRWRKMTWTLIVWTALMAAWMVTGVNAADCGAITDEFERAGCEAGAGIGVAMIGTVWFAGFIVLSLIWFMSRPREQRA